MSYQLITKGRVHQGADCFPTQARGRQSVSCYLLYFITVLHCKHPREICDEDIQEILLHGSNFCCAIQNIYGVEDDEDINPHFSPRRVTYKDHKVYIMHKFTYSGLVGDTLKIENSLVFSLESAILQSATSYKYLIVDFSGISLGIYFHEDCFFLFDSNSRNASGLSCVDGTAVLGVVESLNGLCSYLRNLVESLGQNVDYVQFDFHSYTITKQTNKPYSVSLEILDDVPGFIIHTDFRNRKYDQSEDCLNIKTPMLGKSLTGCVDDRSVSDSKNDIIARFHNLISVGPDYVCCCCTQTFFRYKVIRVNNIPKNKLLFMKKYLNEINSVDNVMWLCRMCNLSLKNGKTPRYWVHNGLEFPAKPPELQLTNFEERLVSPSLAFLQLLEMPRDGLLGNKENIVNVPADVSNTVKELPRLVNEESTIMMKMKEKLLIKNHIPFENICPNKVYAAAKWLLNNSSLFKEKGIVLNESWLSIPQEVSFVESSDSESENEVRSRETVTQENENDAWTEDENFNEPLSGKVKHATCVQAADLREFNHILSVAPAERISFNSFFDINAEVLAFPSIFCGQPRVENSKRAVPLHYKELCKWELRNMDRRVANSIPNIFFKVKRLQINPMKDRLSLALGKSGKLSSQSELNIPGFIEHLPLVEDGYRVLPILRGSPPYLEKERKDLFAMIRQIGIPTWYCSFSSAESNWVPLLQSLSKLANGTCLSTEDCERLSWQEKCKLIKDDPVTCVRYFAFRVHTFLSEVLKHKSLPVGKIIDYTYRIEFQQQGSPRIHMFAWVENAPVLGKDSDSTVIAFIDKYLSCTKDDSIPDLIKYQTHRHSSTCRDQGKDICRFQFPILPMPETVILYPLIEEESCRYSEDAKRISCFLNDLHKTGEDLSFEDFLKRLDMDYSYYCKVVSSTLVKPKVFLKRNVSESRITSYNSLLLKTWMANIDLHYVLDPYTFVSYSMSYFSKRPRGLSNLLLDACSDAISSDGGVKRQDWQFGNQLLTGIEIGAQEAAFLALQIPLRHCSKEILFVDTSKPEERRSQKKSRSELKNLPKNSKDIEIDSPLKRYERRPKSMEMVCYADFISWYEIAKKQKQEKNDHDVDLSQELPDAEDELDQDDNIETGEKIGCGEVVKFPCGMQMKKRTLQKVIYTDIPPLQSDREEHYRKKLMLYTHWRDEADLIKGFSTYKESFDSKINQVYVNSAAYEKCALAEELLLASDDKHSTATSLHAESQHSDEELSSPRKKKCKRRRCVSRSWKSRTASK